MRMRPVKMQFHRIVIMLCSLCVFVSIIFCCFCLMDVLFLKSKDSFPEVFNFLVVGALKFSGVHLSRSSRSRCNGHGGGSFHVQNNLFDRFARVIKVITYLNFLFLVPWLVYYLIGTVLNCFSFILLLTIIATLVICKCNYKLFWRPREDLRTKCPWNEWWSYKDASSYSAGLPHLEFL